MARDDMTSPDDHEADNAWHPAWRIKYPEPTAIIVFWPHDEAPSWTDVHARLEQAGAGSVEHLGELEQDDRERALWNAVIAVDGSDTRIITWVESRRESGPGEHGIPPGRWVVGVETLLDFADPVSSWAQLMRLVSRAFADAPAVLDANTTRIFTRVELDEFFVMTDIDPPAELMWIVHAISDQSDTVWLHTHGLARCAVPELDMVEVPATLSDAAAKLINVVAESMLESPLPPPGEPFEPGHGLTITAQPWQEVVTTLAADACGSRSDRRKGDGGVDHGPHQGVRAALCAPRQVGLFRKAWVYPKAVLEAIKSENVTFHRPSHQTKRITAAAQAAWPEFAMAFATLARGRAAGPDPQVAVFLVKVGLPATEDGTEYLWFLVKRLDGDRVQGELVNDPIWVPGRSKGDVLWLSREQVVDWCVQMEAGVFEAGRRAGLREAVAALSSGEGDA